MCPLYTRQKGTSLSLMTKGCQEEYWWQGPAKSPPAYYNHLLLRKPPVYYNHLLLRKLSFPSMTTNFIKPSTSQFSRSVMSHSLWPRGLQHARPPCPSPTPGVYSNSCPSSWWCHATISSFVIPFPSCLQSFLASGSFQMSQLFASGGQSIVTRTNQSY